MKVEQFERHKSDIGYIAAKYPTIIMYLLTIIMLFIPYVNILAWLVAFLFFFKEKDSKFLRLHAAQEGFILLFYNIIYLILSIISSALILWANKSKNEAALINALSVQKSLNTAIFIIQIIILLLAVAEMIFAYNYKFWHIPGVAKLAKRLEQKTK